MENHVEKKQKFSGLSLFCKILNKITLVKAGIVDATKTHTYTHTVNHLLSQSLISHMLH